MTGCPTAPPDNSNTRSPLCFPRLPEALALVSTDYQPNPEAIHHFQNQGVSLPPSLQQAVIKRQVEYLAGRYCAMAALKRLGAQQQTVVRRRDKSPGWPLGYTGSISHSQGLALAVTGESSRFQALGIDAERQVSDGQAQRLTRMILQPEDQALQQTQRLPLAWFLTLTFSAKESLFKLLYPQIGRYFGFDAAVMTAVDTRKQTFTIRTTKKLPEQPVDTPYHGQYLSTGQHLVTLIYLDNKKQTK